MRILIVTRNLVGYGGIPYSLVNLANGKYKIKDHENKIVYLILENKKIDKKLIEIIVKYEVSLIYKKNILSKIFFLLKNYMKFDVILTTCFRSFVLSKIFSLFSQKVILWLRGANIIVSPLKRFIFNIFNNNIVIANSRYTGLANGLTEDKFMILYNGISKRFLKMNISNFHKHFQIPKNAYVISYIGGWSKIKNHKLLLKAFNKLGYKYKNLYLLLIGEISDLTRTLVSEIEENLKKRVIIRDKENFASKYLRYINLYVHPCYAEGFGNVIIEAIFAGKPVLGAKAGALPEILENRFLFNPFNEKDLITKIEYFFKYKKLNKSFSKKVLKKYSVENFYQNFIDILSNI